MEENVISQVTVFFAQLGVPAILISFAVLASFERLRSVAMLLVSVTVAHFAFQAFWCAVNAGVHDKTLVIGNLTTGHFFRVGRELAVPIATTWIGFAKYSPIAHDQIAHALRWMIGGVA